VVEYTSGASSLRGGLRRAFRTLLPRHPPRGRKGWALLTPVVLVAAGLLLTTTATTAKGTDLRDDRGPELTNLIAQRKKEVDDATARAKALREQTEGQTKDLAATDSRVADQRARGEASQADAGLTALRGPGLTVKLNDAPRRPDGSRPAGARPDDLVVHQQDVQAVVNALWAGGGEAMTIMGVRVISTSAVRCVGNTLLLDGRVYSPPFVITAIGDVDGMQHALDEAQGVVLFREAAVSFGLGYQVRTEADVTVPAYDGSLTLRSASPAG
jgi:uncharacterized protein YlxW (UPF0749 family)